MLPTNCPTLVDDLINALECDGEEGVRDAETKETSLRTALLKSYAINQPPSSLLQAAAERAQNAELLALLAPEKKADLDKWLYGRDIVDVLRMCTAAKFTPGEFVGFLRKLQPRLYSISSSPKAHPGQVHLINA